MLPQFINPELWDAFVEMRKAKGKRAPFTEQAKKLAIQKLCQFHAEGYDANNSLENSILNGWSGLFPGTLRQVTKAAVDPALQKIKEDSKKAAPIPDHIRAQLAALRVKA